MSFATQKLDLRAISSPNRRNLSNNLYKEIFSKIWTGFSHDQFFEYFFEKNYETNLLYLFKKQNKIAGYLIYRVEELAIGNRRYYIPRISANVLPQFMGHRLVTMPVFLASMRMFFKALITRRKILFFFTANSPASYCAFHNRTREIFPNPNKPTPPDLLNIIPSICEAFNMPLKPGSNFICSFPGVGLKSPIKRTLASTRGPIADFYKEVCPEYEKGDALITLMPVSVLSGFLEIGFQCKNIMKNILPGDLGSPKTKKPR